MAKLTRLQVANKVKAAVAKKYVKARRVVYHEIGLKAWGKLRADLLVVSMKGEFIVVEVKSSVADFVNDKKCDRYLKYCHKLYFAMPAEVWGKLRDRVKFPPQVGVMVLDEYGDVRIVKSARRVEIDPEILLTLAIRIAYRSACVKSVKDANALWR